MKHFILYTVLLLSGTVVFAQDEETEVTDQEPISTTELGIDLNFSASTFGGTGGLGLKLGFIQREKFIVGPSLRYQHSWQNFNGIKSGFSIYGGGVFAHARFYNYLFLGTEIEFLRTPYNNGFLGGLPTWVATALVGGGFSHSFSPGFRLNAGIMYDVIDHMNSPFRQGYFMKKENGMLIPVLYRIAFFFPI